MCVCVFVAFCLSSGHVHVAVPFVCVRTTKYALAICDDRIRTCTNARTECQLRVRAYEQRAHRNGKHGRTTFVICDLVRVFIVLWWRYRIAVLMPQKHIISQLWRVNANGHAECVFVCLCWSFVCELKLMPCVRTDREIIYGMYTHSRSHICECESNCLNRRSGE